MIKDYIKRISNQDLEIDYTFTDFEAAEIKGKIEKILSIISPIFFFGYLAVDLVFKPKFHNGCLTHFIRDVENYVSKNYKGSSFLRKDVGVICRNLFYGTLNEQKYKSNYVVNMFPNQSHPIYFNK